jgi:hypothetical protein
MLIGIFQSKGQKVACRWSKLHDEDTFKMHVLLQDCYGEEIKEDEMGKARSKERARSEAHLKV